MNEFLKIFEERGFKHQCTDEEGLGKLDKITAYIGFDLTATSLHVGSLLQIMILRWLKKTGNTPIILLGGATTKVGDPSGKDESRPMITDEVIEQNKTGIASVFKQFGLGDCQMVNNLDWFKSKGYLEILQEVGRHFSVNRMIAKESVKSRLERESFMSLLEFNYMVLQAYDYVELAKRYGCNLQIGGSDQWGNIVEGVELNRRLNWKNFSKPQSAIDEEHIKSSLKEIKRRQEIDLFGLTTPLITTSSGAKMGKTADGAVWLSAEKTSPYEYYQFWRNTDDADVIRFLKFFTELPVAEIDAMKEWEGSAKINDAKKILAFEATKICHGEEAARLAEQTAKETFELGLIVEGALQEVEIEENPLPAYKLFHQSGLAKSGGDARKFIRGGGAKINHDKVLDENQIIDLFALDPSGKSRVSIGKKHVIVRVK